MSSEKRLARIAGSLYLVVAGFGGFAELVVRAGIVEAGNAAVTADTSADLPRCFAWALPATSCRPRSSCSPRWRCIYC